MSMYYNKKPVTGGVHKKAKTSDLRNKLPRKTETLLNSMPSFAPSNGAKQANSAVLPAPPETRPLFETQKDAAAQPGSAPWPPFETEAKHPHSDMLMAALEEQRRTTETLTAMLEEQRSKTDRLFDMLAEQQHNVATPALTPIRRKLTTIPCIEIDDLCKQYGSFQAVNHLSLNVLQGEIFGLLGPNGSGKTTTINMISGLTTPTSGHVRVLGYDVRTNGQKIRQLLGCVPQETALFEELSAWDNMDYHADLFNVPRQEKRARITHMLELMKLLDRKDKRVKTFSGGMKRRLALARALLHDPRLVYLDEPTLGVDVQSRRALWDYILSLRKQGKSVLLTTNYLEEAQELCDRIAILDHGKLVVVDTPQRLKQRYGGRVIELELSEPLPTLRALEHLEGIKDIKQEGTHLSISMEGEQDCLPQIINLITQQREVRDIVLREPSLDEVFLQITGNMLRD